MKTRLKIPALMKMVTNQSKELRNNRKTQRGKIADMRRKNLVRARKIRAEEIRAIKLIPKYEKKCACCGRQLNALDFFRRDLSSPDGFKRICIPCEHTLTSKQCSDCHAQKPTYEFPRNRAVAGGYHNTCSQCMRHRQRAHRTAYQIINYKQLTLSNLELRALRAKLRAMTPDELSTLETQLRQATRIKRHTS